MAKMESGKPKRRRRMESQTSTASNQTQVTQLSFDSNNSESPGPYKPSNPYEPPGPFKSSNSQSDVQQYHQTKRKRTMSEQPYSEGEHRNYFADNSGNTTFYLDNEVGSPMSASSEQNNQCCVNPRCANMPRYGRRNTEHSVNTVVTRPSSIHADEFHRCNTTTTCVHGCSMQQCAEQNIFQFQGRQMVGHNWPRPYDNPVPLSPNRRSRSASNVEHHYISLEPSSYIHPVETSVLLQPNGNARTVPNVPARRRNNSIDDLDTPETDSPESERSSGYCKSTNLLAHGVCGCAVNNTFYRKGFYILIGLNIVMLLICMVGLPVTYFFTRQVEPDPLPMEKPHCFDGPQAEAVLRGPYKSALVMDSASGKHCLNHGELLKLVANFTAKEPCRPALELLGNLSGARIKWQTDHRSCGFSLSHDQEYLQVNETGNYFIYSRIHFRANGGSAGHKFPVGHKLSRNSQTIDYVTQNCLAGSGHMEHMSVLETIQYLYKGDQISVEIDADRRQFANGSNKHKLGIIALK